MPKTTMATKLKHDSQTFLTPQVLLLLLGSFSKYLNISGHTTASSACSHNMPSLSKLQAKLLVSPLRTPKESLI